MSGVYSCDEMRSVGRYQCYSTRSYGDTRTSWTCSNHNVRDTIVDAGVTFGDLWSCNMFNRLVHFDQKSEFSAGHQDSGVSLCVDVDRLFKKISGVKTTTRSASKVSHSVHCWKQLLSAVRRQYHFHCSFNGGVFKISFFRTWVTIVSVQSILLGWLYSPLNPYLIPPWCCRLLLCQRSS